MGTLSFRQCVVCGSDLLRRKSRGRLSIYCSPSCRVVGACSKAVSSAAAAGLCSPGFVLEQISVLDSLLPGCPSAGSTVKI